MIIFLVQDVEHQHGSAALQFYKTLSKDASFYIWNGDLSCFKTNAVVNSANDTLLQNGGLNKALSEAGGPDVQAECDNMGELQISQEPILHSKVKMERACRALLKDPLA